MNEVFLINKILRTLYLSWNSIDGNGANIIASILLQSSLTKITLADIDIEGKDVVILAKVLPKSSLIEIDLTSNNITEVGTESMLKVLPFTKLTSLDLIKNSITSRGLYAIATKLERLSCLLTNIASCIYNLDDDGVRRLLEVLKKNPKITEMIL